MMMRELLFRLLHCNRVGVRVLVDKARRMAGSKFDGDKPDSVLAQQWPGIEVRMPGSET